MEGTTLIEKVNSLPDEMKREVVEFVDSLVKKSLNKRMQRPKAGCGKDLIAYIAPDFSAPLEDFRESME
ncbi:MAG: DUF2281 domain-containing protein [Ignavibacteriae bacterium]|nr:DUF2281 domain-containing protein [Ignavibacteriota bacterium]